MTAFDPERFEDKYEHYFTELQQAYRQAFDAMSDRADSGLVHAIDQQGLSESEPVYDGDGEFTIILPDKPATRVPDHDAEHLQQVLEAYMSELES